MTPSATTSLKGLPSFVHGAGNGKGAPHAPGLPPSKAQLSANFNGLSDADQAAANGGFLFEDTPPDQGLCVGYLNGQKVVIELVNQAVRITDTAGNPLTADLNMATLFQSPEPFSDPRCVYDTSTGSFFFTEIGLADFTNLNSSTINLAVLNAAGNLASYEIDSSLGGNCLGDQPHLGNDADNVYISTDQFCGPDQSIYEGAELFVISKSQLVNEDISPNLVKFGPLSLQGNPVLTLEPTIDAAASSEYLLNSVGQDANGTPFTTSNTLGLWQVTGGANVTSGNFSAVGLQSTAITSETYGFPVPAASTGTGLVSIVDGFPITSEATLNPDDDRMLQVIGTGSGNNERIYGALDTALTPTGDSAVRDGAAWFELAPSHASPILHQGYVAASGEYLLYPAIYPTNSGNVITFTITSPTINPSAAYSITGGQGAFVNINTAAAGAGAHTSFSDALFDQARWGDYSAAALDPNGRTIWMATEYIPPIADQDPLDNWGTDVFAVH